MTSAVRVTAFAPGDAGFERRPRRRVRCLPCSIAQVRFVLPVSGWHAILDPPGI